MDKCRFCGDVYLEGFVDLGCAPYSNAYLSDLSFKQSESWHRLWVGVCPQCLLVQTGGVFDPAELFVADYAYTSSSSSSWVRHCEQATRYFIERFELDVNDWVVELASNDGCLMQNFVKAGIPCLGVEPTTAVAELAVNKGLDVEIGFFGKQLAIDLLERHGSAKLVIGNNVLAHVPDLRDFLDGVRSLLTIDGVAIFEFPHLANLLRENQFDTIYHEHYSYFSLHALDNITKQLGLLIFDVEKIQTHGGSLRVFISRSTENKKLGSVRKILQEEKALGLTELHIYKAFQAKIDKIAIDFMQFVCEAKASGKSVVAYGASAKGNTLFNYSGISRLHIDLSLDQSPLKIGKFLPGSHVPIRPVNAIDNWIPDYIVITPWNLKSEIADQLQAYHDRGTRFVAAIPKLSIW